MELLLSVIIALFAGIIIGFLAAWFLFKYKEKGLGEFEDKFKVIAGDVLRQNSDDFLRLAGTKFSDAEKNVKDLVESVGTKVDQLEKEHRDKVGKLTADVEQVLTASKDLSTSASELKTLKAVLSSSGAALGKWGEGQLKNLLEKAEMVEGTDFDVQETVSGEGSSILRPDFTIRIPGGMTLAIDAKASLPSLREFEKAREEGQSEEERKKHTEDFIRGLKNKINDLSSKEYWKHVDRRIPYVVMFVPLESALIEAFQQDKNLYEEAQGKRVMLASRSIIIPVILLISNGLKQYRAAENTLEIGKEVEELGNRLRTFFGHFGGIGRGISQAKDKFNEAVGSFDGRVLPKLIHISGLGGGVPVGEEIEAMVSKVEGDLREHDKKSDRLRE